VIFCSTHAVHFTVYPPGHIPHGRQAIVGVGAAGDIPVGALAIDGDHLPPILSGTLFEAAWDAGHGDLWSTQCDRTKATWRATQIRRLERSVRAVGVGTDLDANAQVARAAILGVDALMLREGQAMVRSRPGIRSRGRAVTLVLRGILQGVGRLADRLVAAGHLAGLWGRPFGWNAATRSLQPLAAT